MELGGEKVKSPSFNIPGMQGMFHMKVEAAIEIYDDDGNYGELQPDTLWIEGEETPIGWYFKVSIDKNKENDTDGEEGEEEDRTNCISQAVGGELEVTADDWKATGRFGMERKRGLYGGMKTLTTVGKWTFKPVRPNPEYIECALGGLRPATDGFYTVGPTMQLSLVASLTLPGRMVVYSGGGEEHDGEYFEKNEEIKTEVVVKNE
jgi:hypothetical protein